MSGKKYIWTPGSKAPLIEPHSEKKHEILKDYLIHYLKIRTKGPYVKNFHLTLIDGFAGGGEYTDMEGGVALGSPLIMLEAIKEAQAIIDIERGTKGLSPVKISPHFWFVEKDKNVFQYLKNLLKEKGCDPRRYKLINGKFTRVSDKIISSIKQTRANTNCIFVLDQYGYTDVLFSTISKIFFELPKAEVILTFAVDYMIGFLTDKDNTSTKILTNIGFTKEISKKILEQLGDKENSPWRKNIQHLLHGELFKMSGARLLHSFFYNKFEIQSFVLATSFFHASAS